jgi:hypothetical protein
MAKLILLVILITINGCFASLNHYLKMAKTDAVGHDISYFECGEGLLDILYRRFKFLII